MIYFPDNPLEPWAMLVVALAWAFIWFRRNGPNVLGALLLGGVAALAWPFAIAALMAFRIWEVHNALAADEAELLAEIERRLK